MVSKDCCAVKCHFNAKPAGLPLAIFYHAFSWLFIGSLHAYKIFSGVMEVLPLLLVNGHYRWAHWWLQAVHQCDGNLCYDIPVKKLYSEPGC
jgi:hypothetical protein